MRDAEGRSRTARLTWYYKTRYGLTIEEAEELRQTPCEICGQTGEKGRFGKLHIDHCHNTGKVRGALCTNCNTGLGQFQHDPELLRKAIEYLQR